MIEGFDDIERDLDHIREREYNQGDVIREISVTFYRNSDYDNYTPNAYIVQDTGDSECIVISLYDKKEKEDYFMSFNSKWMVIANQDWLAQVLVNHMKDLIEQTKKNFQEKTNKALKALFSIGNIKV